MRSGTSIGDGPDGFPDVHDADGEDVDGEGFDVGDLDSTHDEHIPSDLDFDEPRASEPQPPEAPLALEKEHALTRWQAMKMIHGWGRPPKSCFEIVSSWRLSCHSKGMCMSVGNCKIVLKSFAWDGEL